MRRLVVRILALALASALVAGGATAYWWARRTVPRLDGQERVAGLKVPVEVRFDRHAIPHVYARDADDVWLAAGYLQARERLWQMELYRRAVSGRLSEIFGERTLATDRRFLTLGLRRAAAREWTRTSAEARSALERYAEGVNAVIAEGGKWRLPVEFRLVSLAPEPWGPVDSLAIGKLMAWRLAENHQAELVRAALVRRFGPSLAAQLMGAPPAASPTILGTGPSGEGGSAQATPSWFRDLPAYQRPLVRDARVVGGATQASRSAHSVPRGLEWLESGGSRAASNSWVVAGFRTSTGRPLLANDPHLAVELPSIWYEMHLVAAGLDVAGVTIPGVPFITIGHNQRIGWGLTNVGADVQDFYVEQIDRSRRRYLDAGVWRPLEVERYEIAVRGDPQPETFEVMRTRHGPLLSDSFGAEEARLASLAAGITPSGPRALALRWDVLTTGESASAFEAIGRARSWEQFLTALRSYASPAQNVVYADVDGHIGYAMAGTVPIRIGSDGTGPMPGWTGAHEWQGLVDPADLPRALDPPSGQIVTANNEIDRAWPRLVTRDWTAPFRAARIVEMLGDRRGLDAAAFATMQLDVTSRAAELLLAPVERAVAVARARKLESDTIAALDRLRLWDRRVDGRPVASLYEAFADALWRRTFADEMESDLFEPFYEYAAAERFAGIYAIIDDPASPWFDDIATLERRETREDIIAAAATDALRGLRERFGSEAAWSWDRIHAVRFTHPLSSGWAGLGWFFDRGPIPVKGDGTTVNKTSVDWRRPYGTIEIASYRQVLDVGAWDNSVAVSPTGQSGHAMSRHYFDQNPLWREGQHHPMPYSRRAVDRATASRLILVP